MKTLFDDEKMMRKILKYGGICGVVVLVAMSLARWHIVSSSADYLTTDRRANDDCYTVIVLGARVHEDGSMSGILRERALATMDVYAKYPVRAIVISGDGSDAHGNSEVAAVKTFLMQNDIPENIIIEDPDGLDTYASMKNAAERHSISRAIIVTQKFHLARAVFLARSQGIDAYGYIAYKYPYSSVFEKWRDMAREYPAALKVFLQLLFR